jgi:hypothetical protein
MRDFLGRRDGDNITEYLISHLCPPFLQNLSDGDEKVSKSRKTRGGLQDPDKR